MDLDAPVHLSHTLLCSCNLLGGEEAVLPIYLSLAKAQESLVSMHPFFLNPCLLMCLLILLFLSTLRWTEDEPGRYVLKYKYIST